MKSVKFKQYIYLPLLFLLTGLLYLSKFANTEVIVTGLIENIVVLIFTLFMRIFAISPHNIKRMSTMRKKSTIWNKYFSYIFSTLLLIMVESGFFSVLTTENTLIVVVYIVVEMIIVALSYVNNIQWIRHKYTEILNRMSEKTK